MSVKQYKIRGKKHYRFYANGFDSQGVRIQRTGSGFTSQVEATIARDMAKAEIHEIRAGKISVYTFGAWFQKCLEIMEVELKPSTVFNYDKQIRKWVLRHWKDTDVRKINTNDVHSLIFKKCETVKSEGNRYTIYKLVKRIFELAVREGVIDRNPCTFKVTVPKKEKAVLSSREACELLSNARATEHPFFPLWTVALFTGMRSGELMALKWTDIDFETGLIHVRRQISKRNGEGPTKGRKKRSVAINSDLMAFLKSYKLVRGNEERVLPRLRQWRNGEQAAVTREFLTSLGLTPAKFHDLRSTFITNLLSKGVPLATVMRLAGHERLSTTDGYLRDAGIEVMGATEKLGYSIPNSSEADVLPIGVTYGH